jgi:hypothetical protein
VRHARGDYVVFLDSDDLWFSWTLPVYRKVIEQHRRPAFIAGCPRVFRQPSELKGLAPASLQVLDFRDYYCSADEWRWFSVSSFVIRRDAIVECGGFSPDMRYGEDADLALRLGASPGFVQIKSPETFGYRQGAAEQLTSEWKPQVPAAERLLTNERNARYPGAAQRANERHRIISRHLRPVAIKLLNEREFAAAWRLYLCLFPWNVRLGNWKFVFGFVGQAALCQTLSSVSKAGSR